MSTLRKRTTTSDTPCRCGSFAEIIMTRLNKGVRKVWTIRCKDCKEVKI